MNLKLYAIKRGNQQSDGCVQLVVVDLDRGQRYPINFVCVMPRYFRILEKRSSQFAKIFGEKSMRLARRLLIEAWHREEDPEIRTVINKRIKDIDIKEQSVENTQ